MKEINNFLYGVKNGFKSFGEHIILVVNFVLLSFVYLIGVGFTSTIAKLVNKHFLDLKLTEKSKTYWIELNLKKKKNR